MIPTALPTMFTLCDPGGDLINSQLLELITVVEIMSRLSQWEQ